jgi:hypothetical protein
VRDATEDFTWKHSATKMVYTAREEDIQGSKLRIHSAMRLSTRILPILEAFTT